MSPPHLSRSRLRKRSAAWGKDIRATVMHARNVKTPTLSICGALDRCTPPEEAVQFHNALLKNDIASVLITYPEEGHGISKFPAVVDYAARLVGWSMNTCRLGQPTNLNT